MLRWALLLWLVAGFTATAPASAASFLDPGARVYSLSVVQGGGLPAGRDLVALSDGAVLMVPRDARYAVRRIGLDGRVEKLPALGRPAALAAESGESVLAAEAGSSVIERISLATGARTVVTRLPRPVDDLAVADDGAIWALDGGGALWRMLPGDAPARLATAPSQPRAIAALARGAIALSTPAGLRSVAADGAQTALRPSGAAIATLTDGRLLVSGSDSLWLSAPEGRWTQLSAPAYAGWGEGDGLTLDAVPWPATPAVLAADGSLVFLGADGRLRAVIPPGSPRPGVAIAPATFDDLGTRTVSFVSGLAGHVDVTATEGSRALATGQVDTVGGAGTVVLDHQVPAGGIYDLRLRLTTTAGARAEAPLHVDTRSKLTVGVARGAIDAAYEDVTGDDHGGDGTALGPPTDCSRVDDRRVECVLDDYSYFCDNAGLCGHRAAPTSVARAWLRPDGIQTSIVAADLTLTSRPPSPRGYVSRRACACAT